VGRREWSSRSGDTFVTAGSRQGESIPSSSRSSRRAALGLALTGAFGLRTVEHYTSTDMRMLVIA
jgi:hypothetical protein